MLLTRLTRLSAPVLLASTLSVTAGCELEDGGGLVNLYSLHHPTAADGQFPVRGTDHIEVETDTGWHVIVSEGTITTTGITLHRCDGDSLQADFYWGALNESLIDPDLQAQGVGAVQADEGNYCAATVTYGPADGEGGDTVYLRGAAKKGELSIPFQITAKATLSVTLDVSTIENGGPLQLAHDQYFPKELTFAKTYDRFFDGLEFDHLATMNLEPIVLDTLEIETSVALGTELQP